MGWDGVGTVHSAEGVVPPVRDSSLGKRQREGTKTVTGLKGCHLRS